MAAKAVRLGNGLVQDELDPVLLVVHQRQDGGGTGRHAQVLLHILRRCKGQTGGADLLGQILRAEGLVSLHEEQIEVRLLAVA